MKLTSKASLFKQTKSEAHEEVFTNFDYSTYWRLAAVVWESRLCSARSIIKQDFQEVVLNANSFPNF